MQPKEILEFFAKYIERELGIIYSDHNYFQLQNRLEEIARLQGLESLEKLYEQAKVGIQGSFKQMLLDIATNNETSFFRDIAVFRAIEKVVIPYLETTQETVKIWSAASSTGQEALSISMLLLEKAKSAQLQLTFKITGTDISERALERARSSTYSQLEVQRGLPAALMIKYFKKDEQDRWKATEDLTKHISFKSFNLKDPFFFAEKFHLVLCRNVLIYQSVEGKKEILKKVAESMHPGAYLIMGSGESLLGISEDFDAVPVDGAFIYRRKQKTALAA